MEQKVINGNLPMYDWLLRLGEDLRKAEETIRRSTRKEVSYDAIINEFRRVSRSDLAVKYFKLGIDTSGVYILDHHDKPEYLFLIVKTNCLIPVDHETRNWSKIRVADYLTHLLYDLLEEEMTKTDYELNESKKKTVQLERKMSSLEIKGNKYWANFNKIVEKGNRSVKSGKVKIDREEPKPVELPVEIDMEPKFKIEDDD